MARWLVETGRGNLSNIVPRISVLVPMYNAEAYIEATINSILSENIVPLEVLVIDDKSTDSSLSIVNNFKDARIRVIDGPGAGISACLNAGLAEVRGDVVVRCDADDLLPSGRILRQVEWLDNRPEYDAVCGAFTMIDKMGATISELGLDKPAMEISAELQSGIARTHLCTFAVRKSVLLDLSGFREYFVTAEDIDFQFRLGERFRVMYLPEVFYCYRLHDDSITHNQGSKKRIFYENTARNFALQRQLTGVDDLQRGIAGQPENFELDTPQKASEHIESIMVGEAWKAHAEGNKWCAIKISCGLLRLSPFSIKNWRHILVILLKPAP